MKDCCKMVVNQKTIVRIRHNTDLVKCYYSFTTFSRKTSRAWSRSHRKCFLLVQVRKEKWSITYFSIKIFWHNFKRKCFIYTNWDISAPSTQTIRKNLMCCSTTKFYSGNFALASSAENVKSHHWCDQLIYKLFSD